MRQLSNNEKPKDGKPIMLPAEHRTEHMKWLLITNFYSPTQTLLWWYTAHKQQDRERQRLHLLIWITCSTFKTDLATMCWKQQISMAGFHKNLQLVGALFSSGRSLPTQDAWTRGRLPFIKGKWFHWYKGSADSIPLCAGGHKYRPNLLDHDFLMLKAMRPATLYVKIR